jgi:hypothetical protein
MAFQSSVGGQALVEEPKNAEHILQIYCSIIVYSICFLSSAVDDPFLRISLFGAAFDTENIFLKALWN